MLNVPGCFSNVFSTGLVTEWWGHGGLPRDEQDQVQTSSEGWLPDLATWSRVRRLRQRLGQEMEAGRPGAA